MWERYCFPPWAKEYKSEQLITCGFLPFVAQSLNHVRLWDPVDCSPPASSPWGFPGKCTGGVAVPFSRGPCWPRGQTHAPSLQVDRSLQSLPGSPLDQGLYLEGWSLCSLIPFNSSPVNFFSFLLSKCFCLLVYQSLRKIPTC